MELPTELLLKIVQCTDETSLYAYPSARLLALSQTCQVLHVLASPFVDRPRPLVLGSYDCVLEDQISYLPLPECPNKSLQECTDLDTYFDNVLFLEANFGLNSACWAALDVDEVDPDVKLVEHCPSCDVVARRIIQYMKGPSPFKSLIGLFYDVPYEIEGGTDRQIQTISRLFHCPRLRFLHLKDAWWDPPLLTPPIPEHLTVSFEISASATPQKMREWYKHVPYVDSLAVSTKLPVGLPPAWAMSLQYICVKD